MYFTYFEIPNILQGTSNNLMNLKSSCGKSDAFDCVGIRARGLYIS